MLSAAARAKRKKYQQEWYQRNRVRLLLQRKCWNSAHGRAAQVNCLYGVTQQMYEQMLTRQDGVCAVCRGPSGKRHFHIDHDHATGRVRGLLCGSCNTGIGMLKDSPELMIQAIAYLMEHRAPSAT